jgi:hypothetical protein
MGETKRTYSILVLKPLAQQVISKKTQGMEEQCEARQ